MPGCRGLTTTFRSVGQTTPPYLQRRLLAPLQSIVRSLATPSPQCFIVIISHTCRSRSPVTHPKTPVGSSPRPMPAAPLPYKSSYPLLLASSFLQHLFSLYRPSRRCHGFCNAWASTLPPQSWSVMPPFRVLVLVPAGEHSARRQHRPAPRDGQPPLLHRPGQESLAAESIICFSSGRWPANDTCPVRPHVDWKVITSPKIL